MRSFFSRQRRTGPAVLLYHRVATVRDDPHLLGIDPGRFRMQMTYLRETAVPISLGAALELSSPFRRPDHVVVTFDDGYADNLYEALPILEQLEIPLTVFVTAGMVGSGRPFTWDEQTPALDRGRPLTESELLELARHPLVEIGAHTVTHPHLARETRANQLEELCQGKEMLETLIGKSVRGLAYPYGSTDDFDETTIALAMEAGYAYACANVPGVIRPDSNQYALPRILVRDWDVRAFSRRISDVRRRT